MIDKCEQFNTKETDELQTTELSKIPKIFWDIRCKTKIPKNSRCFWNLIQKHQKTQAFFWNLLWNSRKNTGCLKVFYQNSKKALSFLEVYKIPKKTRVFQNSKNFINLPKYLWNFGILENSRFFWNFVEFQKNSRNLIQRHQKTQAFFGIYYEIPKKNTGFLKVFYQNSKKQIRGFFLIF